MYIGIDLGTSSIKLLLVDKLGKVIKQVEKHQNIISNKPGWSEENPTVWYENTIQGLIELTKNHKNIEGISFSGQMHGLVILDKDDNVIRNAILWNDQRTVKESNALVNDLGKDVIFQETSNIMLTGFTAPKVLWVKNNEPRLFKKISKIMLPKDYLIYMFTGNHATDESDISGSLFYNVKKNKYSKLIIDYLEISIEQLPKVYKSTDKVGILNKDLVALLQLKKAPTIIAGGGDQAMGSVATSTINEGDCSISVGTSGVVLTPISEITKLSNTGLHCFRHVNGEFYLMGVTLSAAASLKWFKDNFARDISYDKIYQIINLKNKNDVVFLPYLNGERTPINNPKAKGILFGLTSNTSFSDIVQSIIEGIAFSLRDCLTEIQKNGINPASAKIIGGGVKDPKAIQIISNVLNMDLQTIKNNLGPAFGAAIIAMVGCKIYPDLSAALNAVNIVGNSYKPNKDMQDYYNNKFNKYKNIYKSVINLF